MAFTLYPGWPHPPGLKRCYACKEWLARDTFSRKRAAPNGLQFECKPCQLQIGKVWRRRDREQLGDYSVRNDLARKLSLPAGFIPPALIEAKRLQLQLHRSTR